MLLKDNDTTGTVIKALPLNIWQNWVLGLSFISSKLVACLEVCHFWWSFVPDFALNYLMLTHPDIYCINIL